ncbi:hypothetical protein NAEGRDRAFT_44865 [Naegleria gruberi]|uniref:Actin n=1 Tax=Naegleria gruberi TaxID=5762 RepID=D2W268_NAEGR|nr:uncharacterized protein NAEGRDRAFT_44865 [Naegleria gruberi]EFC36771.1 hypothetical protein NAEGRDRAFT_44865 [Naegleria gruberi]|eukprot:XP_002669515.1 hypothetical protein NAEGRDRAFT_44865 [Naegleria gruberi strain NEG-M]
MKEGEIVDWFLMDSVLGDTFYKECRTEVAEYPMAISVSSYFGLKDRYKLAEILYETYCSPSVMFVNQGRASLRRYARTGVDVSIGAGVACVLPVVDGKIIKENIKKLNVNGNDLTNYLGQLIAKKGISTGTELDPKYCEGVRNIDTIKAKCFLLDEYIEESTTPEQSFTFDDCTISLGKELYQAPEPLFQPHLIGKDCPGLAEVIHSCISSCEVDTREQLYQNIVFSGASSLFKNLAQRLKKELGELAPNNYKIGVTAPPESKYSVWMGTCAEAESFYNHDKWVTREMYEEQGEAITSKFSTTIC